MGTLKDITQTEETYSETNLLIDYKLLLDTKTKLVHKTYTFKNVETV